MNAAVGLMDGLSLDGDRCIHVIPQQVQNPVPSELALHRYNIQTPVSPVSPLHANPNGSQGQMVSSTSATASSLVNPGGHSGFG